MRKLLALFVIISFFGLLLAVLSLSSHSAKAQGAPGNVIPGNYIVILKDSVSDSQEVADEHARTHGLFLKYVYKKTFKGYAAVISQGELEKVKTDPRVKFVSEDRLVTAFEVGITSGNRNDLRRPRPTPTPTPKPTPLPGQVIPTGVSRIGVNSTNKGTGIGVAVIDTGIDLTHPDLAGNIVANTSCVGTLNGNDDNGHGSHVAGTIAALNNTIGVIGVAPEAKLAAVKVLDKNGSGTWSSVICGIDWVTNNAATFNIKVANMSLGGTGTSDNNCGNTNNDPLHQAICNSTKVAGVTYVVAAGNSAANANGFVPASYNDTVIPVSALVDSDGKPGGLGPSTSWGSDDTFATFSNYGSIISLGAPGVNIFSTWKNGGYNTISGTSMASPHIAGSAALYIKSHPGSTWLQVRNGLIGVAETLGSGHTDPSGFHPEPVVKAGSL